MAPLSPNGSASNTCFSLNQVAKAEKILRHGGLGTGADSGGALRAVDAGTVVSSAGKQQSSGFL